MNRELMLVAFLADPVIRSVVRKHLKDWMLSTDEAKELYYILTSYTGNPSVETILSDIIIKVTDGRDDLIKTIQSLPKNLNSEDRERAIDRFEKYIQDKMFASAVEKTVEVGLDKSLSELKEASHFTLKFKRLYNFAKKEDREEAKREELEDGQIVSIPSYIQTINDSLTYKGYKRGEVIMVVGAPGKGKTTYMINEGTHMIKDLNLKVLHIFLGDMSEYDGLVKYTACMTGGLINDLVWDCEEIIDKKGLNSVLDNLRIAAWPAFAVGIDDIIGYISMVREEFLFDAFILDYDGNLLDSIETDFSYNTGGYVYAKLNKCAKEFHSVVFSGCQPKIQFYGDEILPMTAPVESSRKQQGVDIQIGIGHHEDCDLVGSLHMSKVRRGIAGTILRLKYSGCRAAIDHISNDEYEKIVAAGGADPNVVKEYFGGNRGKDEKKK